MPPRPTSIPDTTTPLLFRRSAVLFPGQGAYRPGVLYELRTASPDAAAALEEISAVTGGRLNQLLDSRGGPTLQELAEEKPDLLQMAIFAASVAFWMSHRRSLPDGVVLLGHSLGEIAAATCAGAFSIRDGARVVQARNEALMEIGFGDGGMLALGLDAERSTAVLCLAGDPTLAVACRNAPDQTVVSGSSKALAHVKEIALALAVPVTLLPAPFAFHGPRMVPVAARHWERIRDIKQRPLAWRLYSTLRQRYLTDADDIGAVLVEQERLTVDFLHAVQTLYAQGVRDFIECGVGETMVKLVRRSVPSVSSKSWDDGQGLLMDVPERTPRPTPVEKQPTGKLPEQRPEAALARPLQSIEKQPTGKVPELGEILDALRTLYADALGYPMEVVEAEADLEADLGVDSLKQTELLTRTATRFGLPNTNDLKVVDFPTLIAVAWEVRRRLTDSAR